MTAKEIAKLAVFEGREIRKTIYNDEWWFVVEDVVLALIDSKDPKQYIQRMKRRDPELGKGWVQIVHTLSIETGGGVQRMLWLSLSDTPLDQMDIQPEGKELIQKWLFFAGSGLDSKCNPPHRQSAGHDNQGGCRYSELGRKIEASLRVGGQDADEAGFNVSE
jgi:hypothetical protein